ncbi:hypothetical protein WJX81_001582 [Elliptochloris bilobata]|uniref:Uncharacterized protein n=1 Tax=Elliptochloris bilobata TaxID=381761 RepID=A0AAW1R090_9CHLO
MPARRRCKRCLQSSSTDVPEVSRSPSSDESRVTAWGLVEGTARLVWQNLWALVTIYLVCDSATFLLHRASHRMTNEAAMRFLGVSREALGNLWWLSNNREIANFKTGYQWIVALFFLVIFAANIFLRTAASVASILLCRKNEKSGEPLQRFPLPSPRRLTADLSAVAPALRDTVGRVWQLDLVVAVRVLPLQALSLLLLPLPWTLPRLFGLLLANPVAVVEGGEIDEVLERSGKLAQPLHRPLVVPYVGLTVVARALSATKGALLAAIPTRWVREIPEIPIAAYVVLLFILVLLTRLQDMLPLAVYEEAVKSR